MYWLATVHPDGRPHVRPVLAVWVDDALHSTTNPTARKGRNLARDPRCAITATTDGIDLVVEGTVARVTDEAKLQSVAYGAPTAGPPPYEVYEVTPTGFGTDDAFAPRTTRWQF